MNITYQRLLFKWANLAPDECATTDRDYRFNVRILPTVETGLHANPWRSINGEELIVKQLNFILLTILHQCATRQYSISFTFDTQGTTATICNGLQSQPHPHPAIAALDAYIQLLEF
jgi:hypothetical protein